MFFRRAWLVAALLLVSTSAPAAMIQFTFDGWEGPALRVFVSRPVNLAADRPVVFVMHGNKRNAKTYRNQWHLLALEHDLLVVVPEFSDEDFPGSGSYNLGNVFKADGSANPEVSWSFAAIEPLFDEIRRRYGMTAERYAIYGHSAGAQFVHRFLYHVPEARVGQALIANAGWYTMPDLSVDYPYGLGRSLVGRRQLEQVLQLPVTVLLGDQDTDAEHESLRKTPEAMAQGKHRYARGQAYFDLAERQAASLNVPFAWRLVTVEGADHDNQLMAPVASELIAPLPVPDEAAAGIPESESGVSDVESEAVSLKVMTFNIAGAGINEGKPLEETIAVLREADADIVGLQEVRARKADCRAPDCPLTGPSVARMLAQALGYQLHVQPADNELAPANAILSRYPLEAAPAGDLGVVVDVDGLDLHVWNIQLPREPYQPYQLLGIGQDVLTDEKQAIAAARSARGEGLDRLYAELREIPWNAFALVLADLNEPSHRDWSRQAESEGLHPMAVRWPSAYGLEKRGYVDAYRDVHPDPVEHPGFTWSTRSYPDDPSDHHDRIDYVFVKKRGVDVKIPGAVVIGDVSAVTDRPVSPWPSPHRAVLIELELLRR